MRITKILGFITWLIGVGIILGIIAPMVSAANTTLNILGVVTLIVFSIITYKTEFFTKFKFN